LQIAVVQGLHTTEFLHILAGLFFHDLDDIVDRHHTFHMAVAVHNRNG